MRTVMRTSIPGAAPRAPARSMTASPLRAALAAALLALPARLALADDGAVVEAVVFADRAEVVRAVTLPCRGEGQGLAATFTGLPPTLDRRTLRAEVNGGAAVVGVTHRVLPAREAEGGDRKKLADELGAARRSLVAVEARIESARERAVTVAAYGGYVGPLLAEGLRDPKGRPEEWRRALDFVGDARVAAAREAASSEREARALRLRIGKLERRLEALGGEDAGERLVAEVAVSCRHARPVEVRLGYVLPGATWRPEYDLRFTPAGQGKTGKGALSLTVAAVVQQATGEDWRGVKLKLSTAKPARGASAPELAPVELDGREAPKGNVLVQGTEDRSSLRGGLDVEAGAPASAAIEDGGKALVFVIPGEVSLVADGRPGWFPIDVLEGSAEALLVAVPKLSPYVFQAVRTSNPARYPLLAGPLHLHRGGSYVGDAWLEYTAPGERIEASLGIDAELGVERVDLLGVDREAGLLSSTRKLERAYELRLENRGRRPEKVELRENLPVSKDERIAVVLDAKETRPAPAHDAVQGFLTWTLELPAGGKAAARLRYRVELPEDWKLD